MKLLIIAVNDNMTEEKAALIAKTVNRIANGSSNLQILEKKDLEIHKIEKNDFQIIVDSIITICGDPANKIVFTSSLIEHIVHQSPGFEINVLSFLKDNAAIPENKQYLKELNADILIDIIKNLM